MVLVRIYNEYSTLEIMNNISTQKYSPHILKRMNRYDRFFILVQARVPSKLVLSNMKYEKSDRGWIFSDEI